MTDSAHKLTMILIFLFIAGLWGIATVNADKRTAKISKIHGGTR